MRAFVKQHQLGYVLTAPFEVHLSQRSRPVQPDVLFIKTERWPGPGAKFFEGSPDLVVEVLSPASMRTDRHVKFDAYERAGIPEYWVVNPKLRSVEVYILSGGEYALLNEFAGDEVIQSKVLEGLAIVTRTLFMVG
jgi:Uma2 family endonuclease